MKKNRNKGFTLIELLAVIIIMGVLMMTAIPAVTKYIENSRKDTFWQTAKSYIDAARTPLLSGEYGVAAQFVAAADVSSTTIESGQPCEVPPVGKITIIPIGIIDLEKGGNKSSFNRDMSKGYVLAINEGSGTKDKIVYYYAGVDKGKNGIDVFTRESALGRSSVKKGTADSMLGTTSIKGGTLENLDGKIKGKTGVLNISQAASGNNYHAVSINSKTRYFYQLCKVN